MLRAKRDEFVRLFREFAQTYPQTLDGQNHLVAYESCREQGRRNFDGIVAAAERGEDVADRVLLELIPYKDSPGYREKGAWIHIAPATGDPRARAKAKLPDDWKNSAEAILRLVRRSDEYPDQLAEACREFSESPYSKGFQAGLITPILNAIRPDEFLLANGKSVTVINYFSGTSFGSKLVDYPELNSTGHALIEEVAGDMRELGVAEILDADLFDIFSHWLVGVKRYFDKDESEPPPTEAVLSWLRNLRTQASPNGRFHYKPLVLLALLDVLDSDPEHPNSSRYEELLAAFEERAAELGSSVTEDQFSQPYLRMRNDVSPLQVWVPETDDVAEIDDSRADRPAYVRTYAPSVRIDDTVWPCFSSPDGRAAIRQELDRIWGPEGRGTQAPWFEPLEHPLGLETELQLILENSKRNEQDLLAAIFRRAILLHQRHNTVGFLGAQRKISQRFSIMVGNVYACAVARNGRETLYLLVDDDATLRRTYEVGEAPFSKNELMWIHGRLDRSSLRSLLEDETVWSAYGRMLPKVTDFPHARSSQYKRGRLDVLTGERYLSAMSETSYWWVNQGQNYAVERRAGNLWARKTQQDGRVLDHHQNLTRLLPGHVIVHYARGEVRAIGEVLEEAKETARSATGLPSQPPDHEGYLVRVGYHELADPIPLEEIPLEWRTPVEGPFTRQGSVRQIYLSQLSPEFAERFKELYGERLPALLGPPVPSTNVWLFQANPEQWSLEENLRSAQTGDEDDWAVTRYRKEMRPGDSVVLWQAGPNAGAYALGELSSHPFERERPPWRPAASDGSGTEWAIRFRYTEILGSPVPRDELLEHPVLGGLQVLQNAQGTNFRVTGEQWEELRALLDGPEPLQDYVEPPFDDILAAIRSQGMDIGERTLRRYHLGLKSRGFVILSGVSGTGKTWLTEAYARAVGAECLVVPVAPNWTTNEDLLGYFNPLDNRYHDTQFSRFLRAAAREYQRAQDDGRDPKPHHLILDEMNLARVEYYFAKFLSAMEVRSRYGTARIELGPGEEIVLPPTLRFAGTVNVDETTHNFADKVYDRAQHLELEVSREALWDHLGEVPYRETLMEVWDVAHPVAPFAFRVLDDIAAYVAAAEGLGVPWQEALDEQLLQKVLTKLKGADPRIGDALEWLAELTSEDFPLSNAKAREMLDQVRQHGFASYF